MPRGMQKSALFVYTSNSARAQIAEAYLRAYSGGHFSVQSVGVKSGRVNPYTVWVMDEVGINVRTQTLKGLHDLPSGHLFDYVITVCDDARHHIPRSLERNSERLHWSFADPMAVDGTEEDVLNNFRDVRDQIHTRIRQWLKHL